MFSFPKLKTYKKSSELGPKNDSKLMNNCFENVSENTLSFNINFSRERLAKGSRCEWNYGRAEVASPGGGRQESPEKSPEKSAELTYH